MPVDASRDGLGLGVWRSEMAAQALEHMALLDGHCLLGMDMSMKRVLILEATGRPHAEIAAMEGVSESTVAYLLRTASSEIGLCLPAGAKVNKVVRGYWVGKHAGDCLADAVDALRPAG
jgi:hypothetical protein